MRYTLILIFALFHTICFGQSITKIEQELLHDFKKISYWRFDSVGRATGGYDSIVKANEIFKQKLLKYTSKNPGTLTYEFNKLQKEDLVIASSDDKKIRMYSWNTWTGGTMRIYNSVCQIKTDQKIISKFLNTSQEESENILYLKIFTITINNTKIYLGYWHSQYSSGDAMQGIKLFKIEKFGLNDSLKLIKTKSGITDELYFEFNFFTVADGNEENLIHCNNKTKTIKIPIITEDLKVTKKFITYEYTGRYFERVDK